MEANLPPNEIFRAILLSCPSGVHVWSVLLASTNEFSSVNISHYFPFFNISLSLSPHRPWGSIYSLHVSQNIQDFTFFHHTPPFMWANTHTWIDLHSLPGDFLTINQVFTLKLSDVHCVGLHILSPQCECVDWYTFRYLLSHTEVSLEQERQKTPRRWFSTWPSSPPHTKERRTWILWVETSF